MTDFVNKNGSEKYSYSQIEVSRVLMQRPVLARGLRGHLPPPLWHVAGIYHTGSNSPCPTDIVQGFRARVDFANNAFPDPLQMHMFATKVMIMIMIVNKI